LGTRIDVSLSGKPFSFRIPLTDRASIENALHCCCASLLLGLDPKTIAEEMGELEPVAMRLELKAGQNRCLLINDAYNSDFESLNIALDFLQQQAGKRKKTLILSDILQTGENNRVLYPKVAGLIRQKAIERFIAVGKEVASIRPHLDDALASHFFPDTETLLRHLPELHFEDEAILLKGARRFAFERIAARLDRQVHRTVLEIDLSALRHNVAAYQQRLDAGTRMMAMVKAAAYGSGSAEIARLLEFHRVSCLAVAYTDEGIELRQAGIKLPILVLNPEETAFESLIRFHLEPEIYDSGMLDILGQYLRQSGNTCDVHVKLDTGMHRLGFDQASIESLLSLLDIYPELNIRSISTHLAGAEDPAHDDFTHLQIKKFKEFYRTISDHIGYSPLRHVLNSAGIARFPQYQMDMVRLGLGMFGIDISGNMQQDLHRVLSLTARISQIRWIGPGESIGYGRGGRDKKARLIGTVSIGYADGLPRAAGNGRYALLVRGKPAPIVGDVCMDMCMIDLSHIPDVKPGEKASIFGSQNPVEDLALATGTIPYEILTGISTRVKRVYQQE
ncbi:MAG: alanine racemase, partial [Saprospiraceae bacterium]|nr:alanine racemase [Saprospiraceae bacterium]